MSAEVPTQVPAPIPGSDRAPILEVTDLVKHFPIKSGILFDRQIGAVQAVDGVTFAVGAGETLGLVGESGCGKSTLSRTILRLIEPTSGSIEVRRPEITGWRRSELRALRRKMQMIFQDPYASLNPRKRVGQIVGDPLRLHGLVGTRPAQARGPGAARAGRAQPRALQPLPARVLRRPAPADRDRAGAGARARS